MLRIFKYFFLLKSKKVTLFIIQNYIHLITHYIQDYLGTVRYKTLNELRAFLLKKILVKYPNFTFNIKPPSELQG